MGLAGFVGGGGVGAPVGNDYVHRKLFLHTIYYFAWQASSAVAVLVRICGEELALNLMTDFCQSSKVPLPDREAKGWSLSLSLSLYVLKFLLT
jgi:hypothetical protein